MKRQQNRPTRVQERLQENLKGRTIYLLGALCALILLYPMAIRGPLAGPVLLALNTMTLVTGVYAVATSRHHLVVAASLAIPQFLFGIATLLVEPGNPLQKPLAMLASSLLAVFYVYAIKRMVEFIIRSPSVTKDIVFGGIAVYIMLGIAWSGVYSVLELISPQSFNLAAGPAGSGLHGGLELIYFSFVTMTTLGYGDITPLTDRARSLAIFQTISGQLYLAVMVARLVSLYQPVAKKEEPA